MSRLRGGGSAWTYPMLHRPAGSLTHGMSKFMGLPTGLATNSRCYNKSYTFGTFAEREDWINNPSAAAVGDGKVWRSTAYGSGVTITFVTNDGRPRMRLATGGADNDGVQFQAVGGQGASDTLFLPTALDNFWMEAIVRFSDTNNDDTATIQNTEFFMGFAPIDTDLFATVSDFVGLHKDDTEPDLYVVADDGSAATMSAADTRSAAIPLDTIQAADDGGAVVNEYLQIGFQVAMSGTDQGLCYPWFRTGNPDRGDIVLAPVSLGTDIPDAAMVPSIAFDTGEAVAKNLDIVAVHFGLEYKLGA